MSTRAINEYKEVEWKNLNLWFRSKMLHGYWAAFRNGRFTRGVRKENCAGQRWVVARCFARANCRALSSATTTARVETVGIDTETAKAIFKILSPYIEDDSWAAENETELRQSGDYKHKYWDMIRYLKDIPALATLPAYEAIPTLQNALQLHAQSLSHLGYESDEAAIEDLEPLWDKVRIAMKERPLDAAFRMLQTKSFNFKTKRLSIAYFPSAVTQKRPMRVTSKPANESKSLGR